MLAAGKIVAFVPTKDSQKARAFYEGKLGFQFVCEDQYALVMNAGGSTIRIAKRRNFTPAPYTVLGWEVQDIESVISWLRARGVVFENYPFIQDRELGVILKSFTRRATSHEDFLQQGSFHTDSAHVSGDEGYGASKL